MASPPQSQPKPGTSFKAGSTNLGTSFAGGIPVIHNQPHVEGGDAAFHMNKNVYYGANSPDTAKGLRKSLKAMLQARYKKIRFPKMPWIDWNYEFPLEHYFVDLAVTEKRDIMKKMTAKDVKLNEIFRPMGLKSTTRILIEGPAGYGKSTLALKLCHDYAKGENYIRQFELVVLIRLRDFIDGNINEMLSKTLNLHNYSPELILNCIEKNQKSLLIILDGYDESTQDTRDNLKLLFKSEYFPEVTVIVTTRPGAVVDMDDFDKRIDIKGITGANRRQFLELHLRSCSEEQRRFLKEFLHTNFNVKFGDGLTQVIRTLEKVFRLPKGKENLFNSPLFLLLIVSVAKNSFPEITSFSSKTDLYKKIFNFVAQRTLDERVKLQQKVDLFDFDNTNPPSYVSSLSKFGKLALSALITKQVTFTKEEILSSCDGDDIVLQMGLLTENDCTDDIAGQQSSWYQPIHLSILEFCAAYHLWYDFICHLETLDFPSEILPDLSGKVVHFVFPFVIGLCGNRLEVFFGALMRISKVPQELIRMFSRCESAIIESTLEHEPLINALLLLVPTVWHTSYFTDGKYTATELLQKVLSRAVTDRRLECIVHDADLDWNIAFGVRCSEFVFYDWSKARIPMIVLAINSNEASMRCTYGDMRCTEIRIFLKSVTNIRAINEDCNCVLTLVEEESSEKRTSRFLKQIGTRDYSILRPVTSHEFTVVRSNNKTLIGKKVGLYQNIRKNYWTYSDFCRSSLKARIVGRLFF